MECSNCHQQIEPGATFCGNCGQAVQMIAAPQALAAEQVMDPQQVMTLPNVASYALATPEQHRGETRALMAVLFGIVGLMGLLIMPLFGLAFGLAGIILGTLSRSRRGLSMAGIVLSSLAILAGLAVWTIALNQDAKVKASHIAAANSSTIMANDLSTPCYSIGFVDKLNINSSDKSCDMRAFNGQTMESSTDAYKVYANKSSITNVSSFTDPAKKAIEKDVATNLSSYSIDSEQVGAFAGSPDYIVVASDKSAGVTVAEAAVYHPVASGNNVFILIHATLGDKSDFSTLEAQWQWK